jgi:hypothetical protein
METFDGNDTEKCLAQEQINGRNSITWEEKFEYDVRYVETLSFREDIRILFETVFKVFRREGINSENSATMEDFTGTPEPGKEA